MQTAFHTHHSVKASLWYMYGDVSGDSKNTFHTDESFLRYVGGNVVGRDAAIMRA